MERGGVIEHLLALGKETDLPAERKNRAAGGREPALTTMGRLPRAHYFVADIAAFSGISMAWSSRYGGQPHPFAPSSLLS